MHPADADPPVTAAPPPPPGAARPLTASAPPTGPAASATGTAGSAAPATGPAASAAPAVGPAAPAVGPAAPAVGPASRGGRTPRDMALSLLVLLVPIALLIGFYRLALDGDEPVLFDPRPAIQEARSARAFPVAEPVGLTDGWRVTAASFRRADGGATLRLGYVAPAGDPVLLVQTNVPVETVLPVELGAGATPRGTVQAGARSWQRYATRPGEEALVWLAPERAVIVVGTTDVATLRALAAALS